MNDLNEIYKITESDQKKTGRYAGSIGFEKLILPFLKILSDGYTKRDQIYAEIEKRMNLDKADIEKHLVKQNGELKESPYKEFEYTGLWSIYHLRKNGFIKDIKRGVFEITEEGKKLISSLEEKGIIKVEEDNLIKKLIQNTKESVKKETIASIEKAEEEEEFPEEIEEKSISETETERTNRLFEKYLGKQIEFVTFHPSFSYEEFVEGVTFNHNKQEGESNYIIKEGIFKQICKKAIWAVVEKNFELVEKNEEWRDLKELKKNNNKGFFEKFFKLIREDNINLEQLFFDSPKFVLIIDEINRGDISKIFGELITLLEEDKRIGGDNQLTVKLPYSNERFSVPPNLYLIGTMNTADRSIALIDIALRRRFRFKEMMPKLEPEVLEDGNKDTDCLYYFQLDRLNGPNSDDWKTFDKFRNSIISINKKISEMPEIGRDKQIGHSFLFKIKSGSVEEDIKDIWNYEIIPLLEEYCYQEQETMKNLLEVVPELKEITIHGHLIKLFMKDKKVEPTENNEPNATS
jgi:hypothetical protein